MLKERIPREFPDIFREPELLSPYDPVSMALYDGDGQEIGVPVLPDIPDPEITL